MENIEICRAVIGDEADIIDVMTASSQTGEVSEEHGIFPDDFVITPSNMVELLRIWKRRIDANSRTNIVLVVKHMENIIGVAYCTNKLEDRYIISFYLHPCYQGKRIGKRLMEHVLAWYGSDSGIKLGVLWFNTRAREFYRGFGFVECGIKEEFVNGKSVIVIEMVKT